MVSYGFDLRNATFTMTLTCKSKIKEEVPTEIFLPDFHFPRDHSEVTVSGGKWTISIDDVDDGLIQKLRWWHAEGTQNIIVRGVRKAQGTAMGKEEEEGYLDQCQQTRCCVM